MIDINRTTPNLQLGLGTNYDIGRCNQQYFPSSPGTNSAKTKIEASSSHLL